MVWFKRVGLLCVGFLCSCGVMCLLIYRCIDASPVSAEPQISVTFPYALTDQPLILHGIYGYEGPYVEDGTDREVCDVAALVVENVGDTVLMDTCIAVYSPEQTFMFFAQCLPAGAKTMVLERQEKLYYGETAISCWAYTNRELSKPAQNISIRQVDMDALEITNVGTTQLDELVVYHKNWSKEAGAYMGGVVYKTYVYHIQPDQLVLVKPGHYTKTLSKIIAAVF